MAKKNQDGTKIGRPTKMQHWLKAFEKVVSEGFNAVYLTDDELRVLTNDLVEEEHQISDRTFESWKNEDIKDILKIDFLRLYKKAMIVQKKKLFEKLEKEDDKWQKYAWIIERKFDEWNLRSKQEVKSESTISIKQITGMEIK